MLGAQEISTTVDLLTISSIPIRDPIPEEALKQALQQSPFVPLPGALNLRDLGASAPSHLKPGLIFRSGTLSPLAPESLTRLYTDLHIRRIFDLRSKRECDEDPIPSIQGIERVWLPPAKAPDFVDISFFAGNGGARGYSVMYLDYLTVFAPTYIALFEQLRDRPDEAVLFHCNAGKDRTGALAAIILMLAGVPKATIASDYALSRIGIEPYRTRLTAAFEKAFGPIDVEKPGITEMSGVSPGAMIAFLGAVEEIFGNAEGYLRTELGFSEADVENIKENIMG